MREEPNNLLEDKWDNIYDRTFGFEFRWYTIFICKWLKLFLIMSGGGSVA